MSGDLWISFTIEGAHLSVYKTVSNIINVLSSLHKNICFRIDKKAARKVQTMTETFYISEALIINGYTTSSTTTAACPSRGWDLSSLPYSATPSENTFCKQALSIPWTNATSLEEDNADIIAGKLQNQGLLKKCNARGSGAKSGSI